MTNRNITTGIAYGVVNVTDLDMSIFEKIFNLFNVTYLDYLCHAAEERGYKLPEPVFTVEELEKIQEEVKTYLEKYFEEEEYKKDKEGYKSYQDLLDNYHPKNEVYFGKIDGVTIEWEWLGRTMMLLCIYESPYVSKFRRYSPCVPGACVPGAHYIHIGDKIEKLEEVKKDTDFNPEDWGYTVPEDWLVVPVNDWYNSCNT